MSDFRKLEVWKEAHRLALDAHVVAQRIRGGQYISLRSQLIRAALSIPANIVEGREQRTDREFARFLRYAIGSASELEYHLQVGNDLGLIKPAEFEPLHKHVRKVRKMLHGLTNRLDGS